MILLFTDFGSSDIYVGQVKARLASLAPKARIIDLLHEAPNFDARASAHLLAALHPHLPATAVTLAVVDPGVGSARQAVALEADGRWYVGPDNGLLSVLAARAKRVKYWRIDWRPEQLSDSFHGRDLFAPIAAMLEREMRWPEALAPLNTLDVMLGPGDLYEVLYVDHYGNVITGIAGSSIADDALVQIGQHELGYARVFAEMPSGVACWYRNSIGLVEIAMRGSHAAQQLDLAPGMTLYSVMPPRS